MLPSFGSCERIVPASSSDSCVPETTTVIPISSSFACASSTVIPMTLIISTSVSVSVWVSVSVSVFFDEPNLKRPKMLPIRYTTTIKIITAVTIPIMVTALSILGFKSLSSPSSSSSSSSSMSSISASKSVSGSSSAVKPLSLISFKSSSAITLVLLLSTKGAITTKFSFGFVSACLKSFKSSAML